MNTARPESARREAADRTIRDLARDLANHDPHPADLDPGNVAALRGLLDRHHAASRAPDACAYAGIGSRRTPPEVLAAMATLAETLGNAGCALSTGGAHGADQAFEAGALRTDAPITVHTPWPGYNDYRPGREPESDIDVVRPQPADLLRGETYLDLARRHHPHWDRCGRGARALFLRNVSILSGASARHGSRIAIAAVVAYTPNGLPAGRDAGGTGHTVRVAGELGIPVVNVSPRTPPEANATALAEVPEAMRAALLDHFPALRR